LQDTAGEQMTQTSIEIPLNSQELVMTGCLVEEEFPPLMSDCCKNSADPNAEDPGIKWGELWNEEDNHDPPSRELHTKVPMQPALDNHDPPRSCRLTEDHLALIFEMRRDLAEQLHNQSILNKCMDILFDSLSSEPVKSRCPTCCQPYAFTVRQEGAQVRLMSSFFTVNFLVLATMFFAAIKLWFTSWSLNNVDRLFWFPCMWQNKWQAIMVSDMCRFLVYAQSQPPVLVSIHVAEQVASLDVLLDMCHFLIA
jgi:hypothetical protein